MAALIAWMRQRRAALHAAGRMAEARVLTACISRALKEARTESGCKPDIDFRSPGM